jgi:hypothetical protein
MLSKSCYGCRNVKSCRVRYVTVRKGEFVYCADGTRNLVDINEEWITI